MGMIHLESVVDLPEIPNEEAPKSRLESRLERQEMSIEVRIPTILRTYTGGAKAVEGSGATLADLLEDINTRNPGLRDRIVDGGELRRFVNVYLNDEDVRFLGGIQTPLHDGDAVTVLPAVAGG